jgi:hypothetical protein
MKKASPSSVRRDGLSVTGIVIGRSWMCLREASKIVGRQAVIPVKPSTIKKIRRVLVYQDGKPPMLATVRRNPAGLHVKIDGAGGTTYNDNFLSDLLYPLDALPVLIARWTAHMQREIDAFQGKK